MKVTVWNNKKRVCSSCRPSTLGWRIGCVTKTVKASQATIEGDLIETTAKTVSGNDGCIIEVTMDSSKDRYGDGKVHTFTCKKLVQNPQIAPLLAQECTGTNMLTELSI